jgi:amino acid adenylation domain-containing protein
MTHDPAVTKVSALTMASEESYKPFPLTAIQHAYWVGSTTPIELGGVSVHYYAELECKSLEVAQLTNALNMLIARHDMLRVVTLSDGQQKIMQETPVYQITTADCRNNKQSAKDQRMAWRNEMSHQNRPTDQWPHFDIRVVLCPNRNSVLHVSLNLLTLDLGSLQILFKEWLIWYQDSTQKLPQLNLSFRDYRLIEQQIENSELYEKSRAYWLDRLANLPIAPTLPLIQPTSSLQTSRFKRHQFQLPQTHWHQLKAQANQLGITPTNILLAVFSRILANWGNSSVFTLNLTLFQRQPLHPQTNEIIGDFTTLNLLAVDAQPTMPLHDLAKQIQQQLKQDLAHHSFSGVQVLRELSRRHGPTSMPIVFTSALELPQPGSIVPPFGKATYQVTQTPQVILDCIVAEDDGNLALSWDVVAELFPPGLIEAMFAANNTVLTQLAQNTISWHDPIHAWLPNEQINQRKTVNATNQNLLAPNTPPGLLHTLFLQQAAIHANRLAIITRQCTLTYTQLSVKAAQIAAWLQKRGVKPNTLVAVVMYKGWEQVVAVLGTQMAGAAYLPINPELPTERQHYLIKQGGVRVILTQSILDETTDWPEGNIVRLCVDVLPDTADAIEIEKYTCLNKPTDIAYVIYTSGSTGQPKGVVIDHRGAVNTILDINQRFGVTPKDRVLGISALNFDLSVYDIFGPLLAGGTTVLPNPEPEQRIDPAHWCDLITQHKVTIWNTVPALVQMLIDYQQDQPSSGILQLIMMSGDWIPPSLPGRIKKLYPQADIYSLGGATEASIWSIYYPIDKVDPNWSSIPYGKPLANQTFQVLDEQMQPRPVWVPGDLYIGGIGLAQGYWKNPDKTAEHFVIHPNTGERLYKTGDLGRYLPDGNLEFLGRSDFQVKIRGHRIELGEIEATLQQHDSVKEVVVRAVGDTHEVNKRLVAYVIHQDNHTDQITTAHHAPDQYTEQPLSDVLNDPVTRMEFKLSQPGIKACAEDKLITMPRPAQDKSLHRKYLARQSYRQFSDETIALEPFSHLLSNLCQLTLDNAPLPKYLYPSAGSLYPVQTYLYIKQNRIQGLTEGFYYYHPVQHKLEPCNKTEIKIPQVSETNQPLFTQSAFAIFLVAELAAIKPMYGDLALNFCLLEAGYMSQLLMTQTSEQQIGLCPMGGLHETSLAEALDLNENRLLLHSLVGGQIKPDQMKKWLQPSQVTTTELWRNQLNTFLQKKLPWYMLPAHYVGLTELPLSANGKINYQALPVPEPDDIQSQTTYIAPKTPIEEQITEIWCDVLNCQKPSVDQDFFELGGDSLLATQVLARLRHNFSIELTLRTLFANPTITELGNMIEADMLSRVDPELLQAAMAEKNN